MEVVVSVKKAFLKKLKKVLDRIEVRGHNFVSQLKINKTLYWKLGSSKERDDL